MVLGMREFGERRMEMINRWNSVRGFLHRIHTMQDNNATLCLHRVFTGVYRSIVSSQSKTSVPEPAV